MAIHVVTTTVKLSGLYCDACPRLITKRIGKIEGVQTVQVDMGGTAAISADRAIGQDEIRTALTGTRYSIVVR